MLGVLAALLVLAHPAVSVTPQHSWIDQPIAIRVSGVRPRTLATIQLSAKDAGGKTWHSSTRIRASSRGTIVLSHARSWTLLAALTRPAPIASPVLFEWGTRERTLSVAVQVGGHIVARKSFLRGKPQGVSERTLTLTDDGIVGEYYAAGGWRRSPAVLIFGGSEGGLSVGLLAEMLAAHGFPSLAIAYFGEPGLPQTLSYVPLEYFRHALEWLVRQPQVDPRTVAAIGISRGGEPAQLLGVHYPALVHAVVAAVASNAVVCGLPNCDHPAWTLGGEPMPYIVPPSVPASEGEAVIPDEEIAGPFFAVCGGQDELWPSCPYAHAMFARLHTYGHPYSDELHVYSEAGHLVGGLMPGLPIAPHYPYFDALTERAREDLWPKLLAFLRRL